MSLQWIDWLIIGLYFVMILAIGLLSSRRGGKSSAEYFLGGRTMPWWLLGLSMVATTFSTDTPNLVTDIVRTNGVSGNWVWWAFLLTGMLTVFVYAKLGFEPLPEYIRLILGVAITTAVWLVVTCLTKPADDKTLRSFYRLIRPGGPGWNPVLQTARTDNDPILETATKGDLPRGILCMVGGCLAVYSAVFASGFYLYAQWTEAIVFTILAVLGIIWIVTLWDKIQMK